MKKVAAVPYRSRKKGKKRESNTSTYFIRQRVALRKKKGTTEKEEVKWNQFISILLCDVERASSDGSTSWIFPYQLFHKFYPFSQVVLFLGGFFFSVSRISWGIGKDGKGSENTFFLFAVLVFSFHINLMDIYGFFILGGIWKCWWL